MRTFLRHRQQEAASVICNELQFLLEDFHLFILHFRALGLEHRVMVGRSGTASSHTTTDQCMSYNHTSYARI